MMALNYVKSGLLHNPSSACSKHTLDRKTSSLPTAEDGEARPLMMRHISMAGDAAEEERCHSSSWKKNLMSLFVPSPFDASFQAHLPCAIVAIFCFAVFLFELFEVEERSSLDKVVVLPIEEALEHTIDLGGGKEVWFRTWGTFRRNEHFLVPDVVPALLFVHGGPGQAVADYENGNKRFFDSTKLFVIEVDQRGTGNSKPSVRDDYRNMEHYRDISIDSSRF
mmetsp:Transcript_8529/g.14803  ORF Transcript_8529/g.14803 Transcript_8529/m.14803 type:complete len:223 (-) Transcript_8529:926-1594(-)